MKIEELLISKEMPVLEAMKRINETGYGSVFIAEDGKLLGILTDGDVRRFILKNGDLKSPVNCLANFEPISLTLEERSRAKQLMIEKSLSAVPLLDKQGKISDIIFANGLDIDRGEGIHAPVVIMAGGLGARLYPYTKILPKPLIPIGELPIVEHIMNRFQDAGCDDFHLIVNYKKNMIKSYFNDLQKEYNVAYVDEDKPLGTGGGLSLLKGKINDTFFLSNCDILIDADLTDIYNFHKKNGNSITMVCAVKHFVIPYGVVELTEDGAIGGLKEKPEMNFLTNTGVYIVEPSIIDALPDDTAIPFTDIIESERNVGRRVGVYPISEHAWMDMGQLEELDNMRRRLENSEA